MRILLILLFFQFFNNVFAQNEPLDKGKITVLSGQRMDFRKLHYEGNEVVFINISTNSEFRYMKSSIKLIENEKGEIVYGNQNLIAKDIEAKKRELEKEKNDTLFKPRYPEGIYLTKEEFINKKPSKRARVSPRGLYGFDKPLLTTIEHNCFFFYADSIDKVKNVFAVSYKGHLYFQIKAILDNRNKTDRAQTNDFPNSFVRVLIGGENYFYTEVNLANQWAQGLAYGAVGGASGGALAQTLIYGKGVVWDFKNSEFNIFKNCEDFNDFIKNLYPEGVQKCENKHPNAMEQRKAIEKIK
ncbi:hypothetical protein [Flavobacterium sp. H122]|uniref:hypothetical protein n=1 Tax=Flavobacterium sp. H122 TaxID=2529860 RepID=UPI0010AB3E48|nr:hypothetical protein [Flavobacterium sp. H122]